MLTQNNLRGRVAIIAGGSGYVGSAIVRQLAADGMRIALLYRNAAEDDVARVIQSLTGHGHQAYQCNLADEAAVTKTFVKIETTQGIIAVAVYAAGSMPPGVKFYQASANYFTNYVLADIAGALHFLSQSGQILAKHGSGVLIGITTAAIVTTHNTRARGLYSPVKFAIQGMLAALHE